MDDRIIHIGNHDVTITQENKELFPKSHICKSQLLHYYEKIAPIMLPYLKNRPLVMQRFPTGIDHQGFIQQDMPDYFPDWIQTKKIAKKSGGFVNHILINNIETLLYVVNQACITPHIWLSTVNHLTQPDHMIFDLDPAGIAKFQLVRWVAEKLKLLLDFLHLPSFIMTTGSRGMHVLIPIIPKLTFDEVCMQAKIIANYLVKEYPAHITVEHHVAERGNKVYVDIMRNSYGQTSIAPYAIRAIHGAPIATPVEWAELIRVTPQKYGINNIFRRIAKKGDIWQNMFNCSVALPEEINFDKVKK